MKYIRNKQFRSSHLNITPRSPDVPFSYLDMYIVDSVGRDKVDVIDGLKEIARLALCIADDLQFDMDAIEEVEQTPSDIRKKN